METRLHRYNINKASPRHGHKYNKYKMCLIMMIVKCIKQHLSNIWSSVHEEVKQHFFFLVTLFRVEFYYP